MTCTKPQQLSAKQPGETITVTFEFAGLAEPPSAPVVTASRYSGEADPAPGNIISGAPQISGTDVLQRIVAGVDECTYLLECTANTPSGDRLTQPALLHVCRPKAPTA